MLYFSDTAMETEQNNVTEAKQAECDEVLSDSSSSSLDNYK